VSPQKARIREAIEEKSEAPGSVRSRADWIPGFLFLLLAVLLAFFESYLLPIHLPQVGERSPQAIRAPYDFVFDQQKAMEKVVEEKLKEFAPIFLYDHQKSRQALARCDEFFRGIYHCREKLSSSRSKARACAKDLFRDPPGDKALYELLKYPDLEKMEGVIISSLTKQLDRGILEEGQRTSNLKSLRVRFPGASETERRTPDEMIPLSDARQSIGEELEGLDLSENLQTGLEKELGGLIKPNLSYAEKNDKLLADIRARKPERKRVYYKRGDLLVRMGQNVQWLDFYRVQACLNKQRPNALWVGTAFFLPFILITLLFVAVPQKMGWESRSPAQSYLLVFFVVVSVLLLAKVIYRFTNLTDFAVPMGASGLVVALLLDLPAGLLAVLLTSLYTTFLTTLDMGLFIYFLISGTLLVMSVTRSSKRLHLLFYSVLVGGLNVVLLICFTLLRDQVPDETMLRQLAPQAFLSAPGAWLVAVLLTPVGEKLFRLTTSNRLRELADLNHPLLKKLQEKAPGTYYHSLAVANLASVAAEAVKADVLLVRVGSYYHDIGKIMDPDYYIENQSSRENPHDALDPVISYQIVKSHVNDGIAIAQEYRFPKAVIDLLAEHHGTTVVGAFFSKAAQNQPDMQWNKDFFRYNGPRPGSVESGILMISDVVEAVTRLLKTANPLEVREKVHGIIVSKFEDKQFEQCRLPTSTLAKIEAALTQALLGILHKRIDYPDDEEAQETQSLPH